MNSRITTEASVPARGDLNRFSTYWGMVMAPSRTDTRRRPWEKTTSPMGSSTTCATGIMR